MAFTGQLGTPNSALGNVELGAGAAAGGGGSGAPAPFFAPELRLGPPQRGVPWSGGRLPREGGSLVQAGAPVVPGTVTGGLLLDLSSLLPLPAPPQSPAVWAPEISGGPPMRAAPWVIHHPPQAEEGRLRGVVILPGNPGGPRVKAAALPLLPRVPPDADPRRLARLTEQVVNILNALIRSGVLVQTGAEAWTIKLS